MSDFDWVDKQDEKQKEERAKGYFNIVEGSQQFVLLSHLAPLPQVYEGGKYRAAVEGDDAKKVKIRGVGWVLQDGLIKEAKLPYVIVKLIRGVQQDPEWDFQIPFLHAFTLNAKNAGTKEVVYTLNPSPKKTTLSPEILEELKGKSSPDQIVERIKGGSKQVSQGKPEEPKQEAPAPDYPEEDIDPADIPF